jgi:IclR family transcriptional regulator, acetate operon repressor
VNESEGGARTALKDSAAAEHARKGRTSDAGNAVEKALNLIGALGGGEPRRLGEIAAEAGVQMPLHTTAIGKCVLSGLDDAALEGYIQRVGLFPKTERTVTSAGELRAELERIRGQGYAIDDEENEKAIRCLAAPVHNSRGTIVSGVSVSTVTFLVPLEQLLSWTGAIAGTAAALSKIFG